MLDTPPGTSHLLRAWHAAVADGIAILWFLTSDVSLALKGAAVGVILLGIQGIVIYQLGRKHERQRLEPTLRVLAQPHQQKAGRVGAARRRPRSAAREAA